MNRNYEFMIISKNKTSVFASLHSKKMRIRHGLFLVEGEKCVRDTIGAFRLENLIATPEWIDRNPDMASSFGDSLLSAEQNVINKISSLSTPSDVIAVFHLPDDNADVSEIPSKALFLCLDGIQDPGNLGTIIRTADWFGFDTVYASKDTVDLYNPKTIQSTMGSLKRVKVRYVDLPALLERSRIKNVYGTLLDGKNMFETELESDGVIVMGNEGKGLSESIRRLVNKPLLIPPYRKESHGESLNVAIATAITLSRFRFP